MSKSRNLKDQEIDAHVGLRLKVARKMARLSQGALGARVGLTFQQVQKHENGDVRISAGRLMKIATALNVPIEYFFEELYPPERGDYISEDSVLNLSNLSETKSHCVRLIAKADEEDVQSIAGILKKLSS